MDTSQIRVYHVVQVSTPQDNSLSGSYCVPASWVRWQNEESSTVLLAYPDEPQEITRKRIKNYEGPGKYWQLLSAQIQYTMSFDYNVVETINECERSLEKFSGGKKICTEIKRSTSFASLETSLSSESNDQNAFWSELQKWLNKQPNSDDLRLSMVNRINESISLDFEISDQEYLDCGNNDVPLDLSTSSKKVQKSTPRSVQRLRQINNTNETADDSSTNGSTDKNLTLKHWEYAPGLIELIPNTGVYIVKVEFDRCLESSRKCTELARYLTRNIFTNADSGNCLYVDSQNSLKNNQLKSQATATIVKFVLNYGLIRNWRPSCEKSIRKAISYQISLLKKSNT